MDLTATLSFLRRRWVALVACTLAGAIGATLFSVSKPSTYQATTRLFLNIPAARGVQEALQGVQLSSNLMQSYARIATSRAVTDRAAGNLDGQVSAQELRERVVATPQPDTLLLDIAAQDGEPQVARDAANAAAAALIEVIAELEAGNEGAVEAVVIDQAVTPTRRSSPRPLRDAGLGLTFGLMVGLALALVLEATDQSITLPTHAAATLGAPVLAAIPRDRRGPGLAALVRAASPQAEAYRSLRTAIRFREGEDRLRTLLVSSPRGGEGATSTAANLAVTFAAAGERTIVIDADLRTPALHKRFEVQAEPGLTSVIGGLASLDEALVETEPGLWILPPGRLPDNPSAVLGSQAMADLLEECTQRADAVIIDAPAAVTFTDAVVLSALVEGVVVVVRWAATSGVAAEDTRLVFDRVGAHVVGVVLNDVVSRRMRRHQGIAARSSGTPVTLRGGRTSA